MYSGDSDPYHKRALYSRNYLETTIYISPFSLTLWDAEGFASSPVGKTPNPRSLVEFKVRLHKFNDRVFWDQSNTRVPCIACTPSTSSIPLDLNILQVTPFPSEESEVSQTRLSQVSVFLTPPSVAKLFVFFKELCVAVTTCTMSSISSRAPVHRVLIEAMNAASGLLDENVRKDFLIIGGAALVRYGSSRRTEDVDIAITAESLNAFTEMAKIATNIPATSGPIPWHDEVQGRLLSLAC